jgi:hypothetical protein
MNSRITQTAAAHRQDSTETAQRQHRDSTQAVHRQYTDCRSTAEIAAAATTAPPGSVTALRMKLVPSK